MASIQMEMEWGLDVREAVTNGAYSEAIDMLVARGQVPSEALRAAYAARLSDTMPGGAIYEVEDYHGRVRIIAYTPKWQAAEDARAK